MHQEVLFEDENSEEVHTWFWSFTLFFTLLSPQSLSETLWSMVTGIGLLIFCVVVGGKKGKEAENFFLSFSV